MNRRHFIMSTAALAASTCFGTARAGVNDIFPMVEIAEGKVRGLSSGGIAVFKGLPYGASTEGKNRFLPPQPVAKWAGIRDALDYSSISPQIPGNRKSLYADLILNDVQPGGMGEDCLALNVWTPDPKAEKKKPVIVRFHGGGFYGGSSNTPGADGEMLSRFGDCVVVTVNHRLSSLGFLYLGDTGEFADSGSVGMQDLVAALQWVKRNISEFGGDPNRVLIFGQSGGGAKVSHVLAMPDAKGLFQSAGVMSGSRLTAMSREDAAEVSDKLLKKLGVSRKEIRKLQSISYATLLAAQADVEAYERSRGEAPKSFSPVMGTAIPRDPFSPDAPPMSKDIPMIISTTLDERTYRERNYDMTWDDVRKMLKARVGDDVEKVLTMYRNEESKATPFVINARIITDVTFRRGAITMADLKAKQAAQGGAPVWTYLWTSPSSAYDGLYGATHGTDVAATMHDIRFPLLGPNKRNLQLADQLSSAWVSLAATGNPNNARTPNWPIYDTEKRTTMVFGDPSFAVVDPRREFNEYWEKQAESKEEKDN